MMKNNNQNKSELTLDERISNLKQTVMKNAITLRKKVKNGTIFKFQKFSKKQRKILTWWNDDSPVKDYVGIIADVCVQVNRLVCI